MKLVVVTGGFDPLHSGHIAYFQEAQKLGDRLIVGVNSDEWLTRKKGQPFMPLEERRQIVGNLKPVYATMSFDDSDGSAIKLLEQLKKECPNDEIIFANGGDRTPENIPEMSVDGIEFAFGVGGEDKKNSSSWILQEWKSPKTERVWGYYRILHIDGPEVKVKELTINPGCRISMQKHELRSEFWFVSHGTAQVYTLDDNGSKVLSGTYDTHDYLHIPRTEWHQLYNGTSKPLKLIEIQYGTNCIEEDIERTGNH
jgi:D-beta-D-heptose 7-phosphate kinase/D-beta-D-heptose 1-phosphate adenosyltransferase